MDAVEPTVEVIEASPVKTARIKKIMSDAKDITQPRVIAVVTAVKSGTTKSYKASGNFITKSATFIKNKMVGSFKVMRKGLHSAAEWLFKQSEFVQVMTLVTILSVAIAAIYGLVYGPIVGLVALMYFLVVGAISAGIAIAFSKLLSWA